MKTLLTICGLFISLAISAQNITFNLVLTSDKSKESMTMKITSLDDKLAMQPIGNAGGLKNMTIIMDHAKGKQIILMENEGKKIGMVMDITNTTEKAGNMKEPKVTVTKENKVIDGYKCHKVISETDDAISEVWVTEDLGLNYVDIFKMMAGNHNSKNPLPEIKNLKGFPVLMNVKSKTKAETAQMKITDIHKGAATAEAFKTDGYQMMDMSGMGH